MSVRLDSLYALSSTDPLALMVRRRRLCGRDERRRRDWPSLERRKLPYNPLSLSTVLILYLEDIELYDHPHPHAILHARTRLRTPPPPSPPTQLHSLSLRRVSPRRTTTSTPPRGISTSTPALQNIPISSARLLAPVPSFSRTRPTPSHYRRVTRWEGWLLLGAMRRIRVAVRLMLVMGELSVSGQSSSCFRLVCQSRISTDILPIRSWGSGTNSLAFLIPPINALKDHIAASGNHTTLISSLTDDQSDAVAAAKGADVAIVFVNADSGEYQPIPVNWSTGDRTDNHLW